MSANLYKITFCSMIVNKKERMLKKGSGYHLDLFLIGCFSPVCGLFGLPFLCAATVRSVAHVSALSVMSRTHAPGEKPKLVDVKEQRVTALFVHITIGMYMRLNVNKEHIMTKNMRHFLNKCVRKILLKI